MIPLQVPRSFPPDLQGLKVATELQRPPSDMGATARGAGAQAVVDVLGGVGSIGSGKLYGSRSPP